MSSGGLPVALQFLLLPFFFVSCRQPESRERIGVVKMSASHCPQEWNGAIQKSVVPKERQNMPIDRLEEPRASGSKKRRLSSLSKLERAGRRNTAAEEASTRAPRCAVVRFDEAPLS